MFLVKLSPPRAQQLKKREEEQQRLAAQEEEDEFEKNWQDEQKKQDGVVLTLPPAAGAGEPATVGCNPLYEPSAAPPQLLLEAGASAAPLFQQSVKGLVAAIEAKEAGAIAKDVDVDEDKE